MKQETKEVLEGLRCELASLKEEVRQLRERVAKQPQPTIIREREYYQPMQVAGSICPNCGQWYFGFSHGCWYVNPYRWVSPILTTCETIIRNPGGMVVKTNNEVKGVYDLTNNQ